jgi:hypothetical protein
VTLARGFSFACDNFLGEVGEVSQIIAELDQQIDIVDIDLSCDRGVYNVEQSLVRCDGDFDLLIVSHKEFAEMRRDYFVFDYGERIIQAQPSACHPYV